jgi:SAM-dependent methyltransferase
MPSLASPRALWKVVRSGEPRARLRANRDGAAAIRLHLAGAAVDTGLLDALARGGATTAELTERLGVREEGIFAAFLRAVAAAGLIRGADPGPWQLTDRGRAIVDDDLVRAAYQAFPGFHTALYRELGLVLAGGPRRRDVAEQGGLIARISAAFEPLVLDALQRAVAARSPRRILDIGCGAGLELAAMLETAPEASAVGVDADADAAALAERTLSERGLAGRGSVVNADFRSGAVEGSFDFALLANVLYYLPMTERVGLLRDVADLMSPGGVLFVVTSVAAPQFFSRHFDLLLRAQDGRMELSDADTLLVQLTDAGFRPAPPRPLVPGVPFVTVTATLPH